MALDHASGSKILSCAP